MCCYKTIHESIMRSLVILAIILPLILGCKAYSASFGERFAYNVILFRQTEIRDPIENKYENVHVEFPCGGSINNYTITAIYVYDNFANSSGAAPSLWRGGVGGSEVIVNLRGQVGEGINSTIEIWGI